MAATQMKPSALDRTRVYMVIGEETRRLAPDVDLGERYLAHDHPDCVIEEACLISMSRYPTWWRNSRQSILTVCMRSSKSRF